MKVVGIDASLRSTGIGVVECREQFFPKEFSVIRNPASRAHSECLRTLQAELGNVLARCRPDAAAIEGGFFSKNARTALILGEVRGVVIATCAAAGVPIYEYSPRLVKQALTGSGAAQKEQVSKMVVSILGLREKVPEDAADALAIAICHFHGQFGIAALRPSPI